MITGKKINELGDIIDPTLEAVLPIVKIKDGVADGTATKINLLNLVDFTFENRPENVLTNKNTSGNNLVLFGDEAVGYGTILIGYNSKTGPESILIGGDAIGTQNSVCIGNTAQSSGGGAIALGNSSNAIGDFSISIGNGSNASSTNGIAIGNLTETGYGKENCIAIGYKAQSLGNNTYQIGPGTALVDNTLNIAFTYGGPNYTLLTGDGKIPKERLPDDIGGGGVPTLKWYKNNTGSTITIDDTSSASLVKIYKNGVLLEPIEDYMISGTTLTLTTELISSDKITTEVF